MILETSRRMGLKPLAKKPVMVTQPLLFEILQIRFIWVKTSDLLVLLALKLILNQFCLIQWCM